MSSRIALTPFNFASDAEVARRWRAHYRALRMKHRRVVSRFGVRAAQEREAAMDIFRARMRADAIRSRPMRAADAAGGVPVDKVLCDCDCGTPCPRGKTGAADRCLIDPLETDDDKPAFEVRVGDPNDPKRHFKIWADGRIEGFAEPDLPCVLINRIPALLNMARVEGRR